MWSERSPVERRAGRLENLVARFPATQDRERELGVAHWDDVEGAASCGIDVDVVGTPLGFRGHFERPARGVDFRVYLSRLSEDYVERGGALARRTASGDAVGARDHDRAVTTSSSSPPGAALLSSATLFPVRSDRSPYREPQRRLLGGLYRGVEPTDPPDGELQHRSRRRRDLPAAVPHRPWRGRRHPGRGRPRRAAGPPSRASTTQPAIRDRFAPALLRGDRGVRAQAGRQDRPTPIRAARVRSTCSAARSPRRCAAGGRRCPTVGSPWPSATPGSSTIPSPARAPTSARTAPGTRPPL